MTDNIHEHSYDNIKRKKSSRQLTPSETKLLCKGLSFCPVPPKYNHIRELEDLRAFQRRLRINEFFLDSENEKVLPSSLYIKSDWNPPLGQDEALELHCAHQYRQIKDHTEPKIHNNLTPDETTALRVLKTDPNIVIGKADKGGRNVIWNRSDYISECMKHLEDTSVYKENPTDLSDTVYQHLTTLLKELEMPEIEKKAILHRPVAKTAEFYILGKTHKMTRDVLIPPGRPICSQVGAPTQKASSWLDWKLKDVAALFCTEIIKDTTEFLQKIETFNSDPKTFQHLITFDVISLYPNIPIDEGLEALQKAMSDTSILSAKESNVVLQLANFVLRNNVFKFNDKFYQQISGTAMGTPFAVTYANIFYVMVDEEILESFT